MADEQRNIPQAADTTSDIPRLYTNVVAVRGGAFDLTLDLGFQIPPDSSDQPPGATEWLARVSMSWEHAASLMRLMGEAIGQYEGQAGQLPDLAKGKVES